MKRYPKHLWLIVFALASLIVLFAPDSRADGRRMIVQMDEPFMVNGELFPPGELAIRQLRDLNPVSSLNEIQINGHKMGIVVGSHQRNAGAVVSDSLIFGRTDRGFLSLHSVARAGESPHALQLDGLPLRGMPATAPLVAQGTTRASALKGPRLQGP